MTTISQAIALRNDTAEREMTAAIDYARKLSASELLPEQYRGKPQNVLWAVEYGRALGLDPIIAINMVHVIKGKPTAAAQLMGALVRKAGHKLRLTGDEKSATAELIRADDPTFTFTATWTMERARTAGLTSNANYRNYPAAMLKARAVSEVCRDACPEVLAGMAYTPEELGADVPPVPPRTDDSGEVVEDVGTLTTEHGDIYDAEVVDDAAPGLFGAPDQAVPDDVA